MIYMHFYIKISTHGCVQNYCGELTVGILQWHTFNKIRDVAVLPVSPITHYISPICFELFGETGAKILHVLECFAHPLWGANGKIS